MKNITKKKNTYYADFVSPDGTRIRKSLGKDKVQAKRQLLQLMADCTFTAETQSVIPKSNKSISFKFAANAFMMSAYKIGDAWDKKKFNQNGERQAEFILNVLYRNSQGKSGLKNI